ncbi:MULTISPECIES: hypothetical protein [Paenibacillus]|jgi:hypothetical protein|uniref:Uncharacterized protein n=1 Tax=Paenibacillus baimaensis TaxID=2982185 RepID=A0ABT2UH97_9BACL|nr:MULTISPECIES: hypothetical protein [unclassified Paenibacillus]MCU6794009.1 hypothetical protein [Paenibacillus sp. WQ 127069]
MVHKEKLFRMLEGLNENDQRAAYEFIHSLVERQEQCTEENSSIELFGKNYFVVPD